MAQIDAPAQFSRDPLPTVETLRNRTKQLYSGLNKRSIKELEEALGGRSLYENILRFTAEEQPEKNLRLAVCYMLTNQLLFYHFPFRFSTYHRMGISDLSSFLSNQY